jgi:tRNA G18 (ribose-2'-O)-methylase SpoU
MNDNLQRGYFGIGIQNGKTPANLGVLWRSAQSMGAGYLFTIGNRYAKQACDTHGAVAAMPYFHYSTFDDFYRHLPKGCMLVGVELAPQAVPLETFEHPLRCAYLLGSEDHGLTAEALERSQHVVSFDAAFSLNVSVAGSIVMYDRRAKSLASRNAPAAE